MAHSASTNSLELSGDTKLFDRVARKWNVDYAFYQTEPGKYLLFFKSGQADAMTACFSEYSRKVLDKAKSRQPTIPEQMKQAEQQLAKEKPPKENRANACGVEVFIKLFYCAGYMNTSVCCVGAQGKRAWRRRLPDRTCPFLWGHRPMPRMRCGRTAGRIRVLSPPLDSGKAGFRDDL